MILFAALLLAAADPAPAPVPVTVVERSETDGTHTLVFEAVIDAPASAVWNALTTPEGWRTWVAPVARQVDGTPDVIEASYNPAAQPGDATTIRQQFIERVPNRKAVYRTVKAPTGFPHFETFARVTHTAELEPIDSFHTRFRLTDRGYSDDAAGRQLLAFFREGNRETLDHLRQRFITGPIEWSTQR
jgi:uncharacterized protein YndB with AHSA1/START domain